jgi:hypothetical protein
VFIPYIRRTAKPFAAKYAVNNHRAMPGRCEQPPPRPIEDRTKKAAHTAVRIEKNQQLP